MDSDEKYMELLTETILAIVALIDSNCVVSINDVDEWISKGVLINHLNEMINSKHVTECRIDVEEMEQAISRLHFSKDSAAKYNISNNGLCYLIALLTEELYIMRKD
ncbi:MAG: hypothetical protein J5718_05050 [Lachnospiraceae bacterium]|nr:hypothetical protein [Lachnospiraceae bacterium]